MRNSFIKKSMVFVISIMLIVSCTLPTFAAQGEETINGFTLQELIDAVNNEDKNTINEFLCSFEKFSDNAEIAPYWQSDTSGENDGKMCHAGIMQMGFILYAGDMQKLFGIPSNFGYLFSELALLGTYSEIPDAESSSANADHFYNPETGDGWNIAVPNAKERFEEFYNQAVLEFSSNRTLGLQDLGRAMHFIQDINEPHHASNAVAVVTSHVSFEHFASSKLQQAADTLQLSNNRSLYDYAHNQQPVNLFHNAALTGHSVYEQVQYNDQPWDAVAISTLKSSMYYTASVLYKFAKDTHMI